MFNKFNNLIIVCFCEVSISQQIQADMLYLQGYQNYQVPDKDIGLFTFYRQQAQQQNIRLSKQQQIASPKKETKSNQIKLIKKHSTRLSTLDNDRNIANMSMQKQRKNVDAKLSKQDFSANQEHLDQYLKNNNNEKNLKIFANRKHLSMNKRKKYHTNCPEQDKSSQYFSPRSRIFHFEEQKHCKNTLSQEIQTQRILQPRESVRHLPKIQPQPMIKYRNKNMTQNYTMDEEHGLKYYKYHQTNECKSKQRMKSNVFDKDEKEVFGTFIMISSRQYQLMSERKDVPLISILKKYSRNC